MKMRHLLLPPVLMALLSALILATNASAHAGHKRRHPVAHAPTTAPAPRPSPGRSENPGTPVPGLHVTHLDPAAGKYLNVFYLSAREASLGLSGQQLHIRAVLGDPVRVLVPPNGVVDLPARRVPRRGIRFFNYVYFAITGETPNPLYLRNPDGSGLLDDRITPGKAEELLDSDFQAEHTGFLSAMRLKTLPGYPEGPVQVDSMRDIEQ